jgi:GNAT superfamily N-acetyltransferase
MGDAIGRVREATDEDSGAIAAILVDAFERDPFFQWMFGPEKAQIRRGVGAWLELVVGLALPRGSGYLAGDEGAAIWLPPSTELVGPDELAAAGQLLGKLVGSRAGEVLGAIAAGGNEVSAMPHWLCLYVGVRPAAQGRGLGRALLQPGLDASDASRMPAHLVATNPATAPFYERLGFRTLGEVVSSPGIPPLRPMWRDPV